MDMRCDSSRNKKLTQLKKASLEVRLAFLVYENKNFTS